MLSQPPGANLLIMMLEISNAEVIHFYGWLYMRSHVLLTTPEAIIEVLNAHTYDWVKHAPARKFLSRILGDGLVVVEGAEHKKQRKSVTPAFAGKNIKDLVPLFWARALVFSETLAKEVHAGRDVVEMSTWTSRVTLDIIGVAGARRDFNTLKNDQDPLAKQYEAILDPEAGQLVACSLVNMFVPPWIVRQLPWKINRKIAAATHGLRQLVKGLLVNKKIADEKTTNDESARQKDILSILLRSRSFNDDGLVDQLLTFLAAGHETTSSAMTWATFILSRYPEMQTRLREEVRAHITDPSTMDAATIQSLPLLHGVCSETLRFYPTVPVTVRECIRPTHITSYPIRPGTIALLAPWAVNRLPALWGLDAGEFNPDR